MYEAWLKTNQKHLVESINQVKTLLKQHLNPQSNPTQQQTLEKNSNLPLNNNTNNIDNNNNDDNNSNNNDVNSVVNVEGEETRGLWSVERLGVLFGLSSFEKQIIVLCVAQELDSEVKTLISQIHDNPNMSYPTFGLALTCFPNTHWSALTPTSPLRRFRLIDLNLNTPNNVSITNVPLHISERILHYIKSVSYLDPELQGIIKPLTNNNSEGDECGDQIVESHLCLAKQILNIWHNNDGDGCREEGKVPLVQLCGVDEAGKRSIAQRVLANRHLHLWHLPAELIPQKPQETTALAQLWMRESALLGAGLLITTTDNNTPNNSPETEAQIQKTTLRFIEQTTNPTFLSTKEPWQTPNNPSITLQVNNPLKTEQHQLWQTNIQKHYYPKHQQKQNQQDPNLQNTISTLVQQFNFNAATIKETINKTTQHQHQHQHQKQQNNNDSNKAADNSGGELSSSSLHELLWASACDVSRPKFLNLAQQITPKSTLENLVLPEREKQLLNDIIIHVAQRHKVYQDWGFENTSSRGLGINALFCGSSGTGKTMAAEAIANELHLDLFRIDLSAVVSKYIGETEKNLSKLFDTAEDTGAILFFDEADALFGKRTDIKDSHDRHANIEINYLLQRMENYRGLAILATNLKETLDAAFTRRLKFIINFPFPDEKSRLEIWKNIYPKQTPTDNNIDYRQLAKLNITGGNIKNIALYSAFLAANQNTTINMQHIKRATQTEYTKIEKPLPTGNWTPHENKH